MNVYRSFNVRRSLSRLFIYLMALLVVFVCVAPFLWLVISSVSLERDLYQRPRVTWIPTEPTFERILALATGGTTESRIIGPTMQRAARDFLFAFRNSVIVATTTTAIALVVGSLAAYAYSRFSFAGNQWLFGASMVTRMLPPISLAIPLYIMMSSFGLMDSKVALIITYNLFLLPVCIWIMSNYFHTIPKELEDAARIDGCSNIGILLRIILPISMPVMVTVAILSFLMAWDEFFFALIFTQTTASKTLPKAISEFSTQFGGMDYGMVATGGVLVSLIPVAIALLLQRYIVSGLTSGAIKG